MPFAGPDRRQKVLVLLTMCFALFMAMLDNTVVNVALPTIRRELGTGISGLQWIVDGYVLAFGSLMLIGGVAGDRFGRKRVFMAGLAVFTFASLLCGLADSTGQLVAFRALQGVGAALLLPGTLAILTNTFPAHERAQAIGIWAGVSGMALALGPTAGGWIIEHAGWETVFFLNVPVGVLGIVATTRTVSESRSPSGRRFDVVGLCLGTAFLTSVTYALIESNQRGWADPVIVACLVAAAVAVVLFVGWERRVPEPMMPLSLYRIPAFAAGSIVAFAISFAMFGTVFFVSLYFQLVRGYSAFEAGVRFLPMTGVLVVVAPTAGRFAQRYGSRWPMTFGLACAGTGLLLLGRTNADTQFTVVAPAMTLMGVGMGSTMSPMTAAVMNAVGPARAGLGSATTNAAREIGGVFGVALLGTILTTKLKSTMATALAATSMPATVQTRITQSAGHGELDPELVQSLSGAQATLVQHAFDDAFMSGFRLSLLVAGVIVLTAAVVANRYIPSGAPQDRQPDPHEGRARSAVP